MAERLLEDIKDALLKGEGAAVTRFTKLALDSGVDIRRILDNGLIAGMDTIGSRFKAGEIFIPEVLISAKAMHAGMAVLEPHLVKHGIKPVGKVAIGTVKGDLHDIGKNIVGMMLKGACFEVADLGIDVAPERFVEEARRGSVNIIAMSSLLTTSMGAMKETVNSLKETSLRDKVKIMVGGAPVTQEFADSIGADGYAKNAAQAVDVAKGFLRYSKVNPSRE
jgi:5-methyltetrahydrofolate--homocysteine methyltransferase